MSLLPRGYHLWNDQTRVAWLKNKPKCVRIGTIGRYYDVFVGTELCIGHVDYVEALQDYRGRWSKPGWYARCRQEDRVSGTDGRLGCFQTRREAVRELHRHMALIHGAPMLGELNDARKLAEALRRAPL